MASGSDIDSVWMAIHFFVNFDIFKWLYLAYFWVYLHHLGDFVKLDLHFMTMWINSPLWKRVIAWERSCAASGYGIIWGDADRNKQEEFSAECHSVDWF